MFELLKNNAVKLNDNENNYRLNHTKERKREKNLLRNKKHKKLISFEFFSIIKRTFEHAILHLSIFQNASSLKLSFFTVI